MASGHLGAAFRQVGRLFTSGSVSGFTEAQLLARFLQHRDEAAFEALVQRYGPMVLGVCRQSLKDSHAVDDAFQATFLVLVRRGHTIRDPSLLGNWLYGVAVKVSRRARADRFKRQGREKGGVEVMADPVGDRDEAHDLDLGPVLHEELARLPQKYRLPLVLCFLEGRTHDEAAQILNWPVGTVKGRVARAKDLLRGRLSRRGVTASAAVLTATLGQAARAGVPPVLLEHTVKAAMGIAAGGAVAAGLSSAGAYSLSEGVLTTMAMTKMKLLAAGTMVLAISATGAAVYATYQGPGGNPGAGNASQATTVEKQSDPLSPTNPGQDQPQSASEALRTLLEAEPAVGELPPISELNARRIDAAKQRLDAQAAYYQNGTVTIDRYIDAARQYMLAKMDGAKNPEERLAAAEDNVRLLRVLKKSEEAKYEGGVGALPNVAEAASDLAEAEVELARLRQAGKPAPTPATAKPGGPQIEEDEADKAQNEKIRAALSKRMSFPFAQETPLDDVIKYLQNATSSPEMENGVPIYVDPNGLQEAEKTLASPIQLNVEGIKAATGLRLILKQLDLGYFIREGLLTITSLNSEDYKDINEPGWREREAAEEEKIRQQGARGFGGGGGGGFR